MRIRFAQAILIALVLCQPGCSYYALTGEGMPNEMDAWLASYTAAMFAGLEKSSPSQKALGGRVNVPLATTSAGFVSGIAGVQRQWFDGGHDNVFTVGLQGRRPVAPGTWVGPEITYNNWRVTEEGFGNSVANVIGAGGAAGHRIGEGPFSIFGAAGLLFFSDFKEGGDLVYEGGTGWQIDLGFEIARD